MGNLSHEIKTPITAITGFSETLLDGALNDKEVSTKYKRKKLRLVVIPFSSINLYN